MQTRISDRYLDTPEGRDADGILRNCVHCGFCTATCPTYQLLGDELDGPRGRIYLIKEFLEGEPVSRRTQRHLDRCLTCRSCETTCPSGVRYGRLVDIGRELIEARVPRPVAESAARWLLRRLLPYPHRVAPLLRLGQTLRPVLPAALRAKVPARQSPPAPLETPATRHMLVLDGCVQGVATPATNAAAARVLRRLGIALLRVPGAGCCGAVSQHLSAPEEARDFMRRNIDAWWPHVARGAEAIVITASGCGVLVKEYGELLKGDPEYRDKARHLAGLARDLAEVVRDEHIPADRVHPPEGPIAFHSPCTLQHGQRLDGVVEALLAGLGFRLTPVQEAHLCCGSAGTYSILQPRLSGQLLANKLTALERGAPEAIATANVGCQMHLATRATRPVRHWIELLDEAMTRQDTPLPSENRTPQP